MFFLKQRYTFGCPILGFTSNERGCLTVSCHNIFLQCKPLNLIRLSNHRSPWRMLQCYMYIYRIRSNHCLEKSRCLFLLRVQLRFLHTLFLGACNQLSHQSVHQSVFSLSAHFENDDRFKLNFIF